jgi:hypothetical protein
MAVLCHRMSFQRFFFPWSTKVAKVAKVAVAFFVDWVNGKHHLSSIYHLF